MNAKSQISQRTGNDMHTKAKGTSSVKSIPRESSKKVYISRSGCCRRRGLDATRLFRYFQLNHCIITDEPKSADYLILVTCAFNKQAEDQSLELIREMKRNRGELLVLGCLPAIAPTQLSKEFTGLSLSTKDLALVDEIFAEFDYSYSNIPDACQEYKRSKPAGECLLRICYGCLGKCTFCAVHRSTGSLVSKSMELCLGEYARLLNEGFRHFTICGDDVGAYGLDVGSNLDKLLEEMSRVDSHLDVTWDLPELHPNWALKYKSGLSARVLEGKLRRIGCTIQSGSESILKRMNRSYDKEKLVKTLHEFRQINPEIHLYTHVLVGFPGETNKDFSDTIEMVKRCDFDDTMIFMYSDREGTFASRMRNKVDEVTKMERASQLKSCLIWRM